MREITAFESLLVGQVPSELPELDRAVSDLRQVELAPGERLFEQGSAHPHVYVVRKGLLKLVYLDDEGEEWIKSFAHEGRFFASIAALPQGGLTSFEVRAIEACTLERIAYATLDALANRHLAWSRALQALTMIFATRKEQRERELLTLRPQARYQAFIDEYPGLATRIPQKDLARYLGLTPVGLNRIVVRVRRGS